MEGLGEHITIDSQKIVYDSLVYELTLQLKQSQLNIFELKENLIKGMNNENTDKNTNK